MPGQIGNPGGGRKSAYQEKVRAEFLSELWDDEQAIEKLKAQIQSGTYAAKHIFALKVLSGNEPLLKELVRKLFPDLHDLTSKGNELKGLVYLPQRNGLEADGKTK